MTRADDELGFLVSLFIFMCLGTLVYYLKFILYHDMVSYHQEIGEEKIIHYNHGYMFYVGC